MTGGGGRKEEGGWRREGERALGKDLAAGKSGLQLRTLLGDLSALQLELLAVDEVASAGENGELSNGVFRLLGAHLSRAFLRICNSIALAVCRPVDRRGLETCHGCGGLCVFSVKQSR